MRARATQEGTRALAMAHRLVTSLDRHHVLESAGAIAFDAFLSLIPLLAGAGYLLHRFHQSGALVLESIAIAAPEPIAELAGAEFLRLSDSSAAALAPISVIAFLWVSSSGVSTAMSVFERMFVAKPRSFLLRRAIALGSVVAAVVAISLATLVALGFGALTGSVGDAVVGLIAPVAMLIGGLTAFLRVAIRRPSTVRRRALPGAMVTLVLWTLVTILFSAYVATLARYATLYGSLAAVAILMFWLWLLALSLLVGGEVNAVLEGVRDDLPNPPSR